jgi:hypothetical protein
MSGCGLAVRSPVNDPGSVVHPGVNVGYFLRGSVVRCTLICIPPGSTRGLSPPFLTFYSLWPSDALWLAAFGTDFKRLRELMGHRSGEATQMYVLSDLKLEGESAAPRSSPRSMSSRSLRFSAKSPSKPGVFASRQPLRSLEPEGHSGTCATLGNVFCSPGNPAS